MSEGYTETQTCPTCKGWGKVEAWNGYLTTSGREPKLECPTCKGRGQVTVRVNGQQRVRVNANP